MVADDVVPGQTQHRFFLPVLIAAWFGGTLVIGTLAGAAMPRVLALHHASTKETTIALIAGIGGVVVVLVTPVFGRLSDRTMSARGMRRPWMVGGVLIGSIGVVILAYTTSVPMMVLGWSIVQFGYGALSMAQHALLADQIPKRIRARVSGAMSISNGLAFIGGAAVVAVLPEDQQPWWFLIAGGVGGALCLALAAILRDLTRSTPPPPLRLRDVLGSYWFDVRAHPDFGWAWLSRALVTMAILSVQLYMLFYIIDVLKIPRSTASGTLAWAYACYLVAGFATAAYFGWSSDRSGRRKPVVLVAAVLSGVGLAVALVMASVPVFLAAVTFVGAGQGAFVSVDVALLTEVLPHYDEAGKDLGLVSLSYQAPQVLAPLAAAFVLGLGDGSNYRALFLWAILLFILGGLSVIPIKTVR